MNWGEIELESLKKMFLNKEELLIANIEQYKTDKAFKTYLYSMPQACNEAINYIMSELGGIEEIEDLDKQNESNYYDLKDLDGFYKLKKVICPNNVTYNLITKEMLKITNWNSGNVKVVYEKKPSVITSSTPVNKKIDLQDEYTRIIPLYIAGSLYKDDDVSQATMYMNEFMNMINVFKSNKNELNNPKIQSVYDMRW